MNSVAIFYLFARRDRARPVDAPELERPFAFQSAPVTANSYATGTWGSETAGVVRVAQMNPVSFGRRVNRSILYPRALSHRERNSPFRP